MKKQNFRPRLKKDEVEILEKYRAIKNHSNDAGLDDSDVKHGWLKTTEASLFFTNPNYGEKFEPETVDFDKIFKGVKKLNIKAKTIVPKCEFDKIVFTDVHIGMDSSDGGRSLYDLKWNESEVKKALESIIEFTIENRKSDTLLIEDLGDFLDGLDGYTTRGGHKLPQNLNNQQSFDLALHFKISLVYQLSHYYKKIIFTNVVNDNHSGDFSYFVCSALKNYCERAFENVEIILQKKFIDYQIVGNYCFVKTHGKDTHNIKYGFKAKLDDKQANKIIGYLNENNLLNKGYQIIFEKGDSHQFIFDNATSDLFDYFSYPALSPSSNWVQTNFKKGKSGFVHFNYYKDRYSINPLIFNK